MTAVIGRMTAIIGRMTAIIGPMTAIIGPMTAIIGPMTAVLGSMIAIIGRMTAVLGSMTAIIGGMTAVLASMTAIIGPMTAVLGSMTAIIGRMTAILGSMIAVLGSMIAIIGRTTAVLEPMIAVIVGMTAVLEPMIATIGRMTAVLRPTCTALDLASPCPALMAPPDSKRSPILRPEAEAFDDEEAPISEPRPSSPAADHGLLSKAPPSNDIDAGMPVTRELTYAFLAKKATRDRIREVVAARVPRGTQDADVDDISQEAILRAMETTALAETVAGLRPWVSRVAQNHVIDHYRNDAKHLRWLNRAIDVQELPPDAATEGAEAEVPAADPTAPPRPIEELDRRMIGPWLDGSLETKAEKLTVEMLKQKAASKLTNAEIAAEYGMSEGAFDQRVQRLKAKWTPRWKKHKRDQALMVVLLILLGVVMAAVLWALLHRKTHDEAGPTAVPVLSPAPTASVPPPEQFNNADPTQEQEQDGKKPQRGKP